MYKFLVFAFVAFVAIQVSLAKPKAKQSPPKDSQIDELAATARQVIQNVSAVIDGNLPDSKQVANSIAENSQKISDQLKSFIDDLSKQTEAHKGDFENVFNQIKSSLSETATKLQATVGPEATAKAKELKANFDDGLKKTVAEAEKLAKAVEPNATQLKTDVTNAVKNLLDQIVETGKNLKTEIDKSAAKS